MNKKILICVLMLMIFALVLPAERDTKNYKINKIDGSIKIDGVMDEDLWNRAKPIEDLKQKEPIENSEPSRKTVVKALYNEEFLYFGIKVYDAQDDIIAYQMERDSHLMGDDFVGILLDTFHDKRNGYIFAVSPVGMKHDAVVFNNSENTDPDWNGIWYSKVEINPDVWVAEIAIPFKTISFDPSTDTWGFNIIRHIKRNQEIIHWAYPTHDSNSFNPALTGTIEGLENLKQGIGLDIKPFFVGSMEKPEDTEESSLKADAGVDIFYNISANLKASLTFNTDFAETEVDNRQINLSRFPIIFPEKRDFFLEGSGLFDMPRMHGDLIPFFSRRIGLYDEEEVPIRWGGKITGHMGAYNIGFLNVQTDKTDNLSPENLTVLRLTRNLWEQSHIGMIFTNGNPSGAGYNRLYGVDFRYGTSKMFGNKNFYFTTNFLKTEDETLPNENTDSWKISFDYPNDLIDASIDYWEIGENFNPALGYLRRAGIKTLRTFVHISPRPNLEWLRKISFFLYYQPTWSKSTGELVEERIILKPFDLKFESGDSIEFEIDKKFDSLDEEFEISEGIIIPVGNYNFTKYRIEADTSGKRPVMITGRYEWGDYYEGTTSEYNVHLMFKPNEHLFASVFTWANHAEMPWGDFTARILGSYLVFKFNPDLSWKNIVQYDNDSKILGIYSKIRWIPSEGNNLYFVVQKNWEKQGDDFIPYNWRIDLKYQHSIRF